MKTKIITAILASLLAVSAMGGCTKDPTDDPAVSTSGTAAESTLATTGGKVDLTHDPEEEAKKEEIRNTYAASAEDKELLANEETQSAIKYTGFEAKYFNTPALSDDIPYAAATPIYSHSRIHNYIEESSANYDLGEGADSFTAVGEGYMDSYFTDNGLVVISFTDEEGGGSYTLTGAWDEHIHGDSFHLDTLVFALKKTPGENKTGHFIIEADSDFLETWDSFSVSIYE
ncbi:MAG: hypothetical protein IJ386_01600 [Clostridia bacterium]|nr:hypothetical protein [Clostridia bacterium]